jgi:hypothetical protein
MGNDQRDLHDEAPKAAEPKPDTSPDDDDTIGHVQPSRLQPSGDDSNSSATPS